MTVVSLGRTEFRPGLVAGWYLHLRLPRRHILYFSVRLRKRQT